MYNVGDYEFKNKKACGDFIKEMLRDYEPDAFICKIDEAFLLTLLKQHPEYEDKVRSGIIGIKKKKIPPYSTFGFVIIYQDGSEVDFSYRKCLNKMSHEQEVLKALRQIAFQDILEFKDWYFENHPEIVEIKDSCHVHHIEITFRQLVSNWLSESGITFEDIKLKPSGKAFYILSDSELIDSFHVYHLLNAKLEVLSIDSHILAHKEAIT